MEHVRITPQEVRSRQEGEPVAFLDDRNPRAWGEATDKLPGAIRVPADQVDAHLSEIPNDRTVVAYCT